MRVRKPPISAGPHLPAAPPRNPKSGCTAVTQTTPRLMCVDLGVLGGGELVRPLRWRTSLKTRGGKVDSQLRFKAGVLVRGGPTARRSAG